MRWYRSVRRRSEIAHVRRRGQAAGGATVIAYATASPQAQSAVAVSVSKAVGGAVTRNLVRRRVKGALEGCPAPATPMRLVFVARPAAATEPYARLATDVSSILRRLTSGRPA